MTPFPRRCEILANLWVNHRESKDLHLFIDNQSLGLPLSYAVWAKLVIPSPEAKEIINQAWNELVLYCEGSDLASPLIGNLRLAIVLSKEIEEANA